MTASAPSTRDSLSPGTSTEDPGWGVTALALALITLIRLVYLATGAPDLFADEAQYWTWSRSFEFGYFSKPPLLGWAIGAATAVCGDTAFCVRVPAALGYALAGLFLYGATVPLAGRRVAFWTSVVFATLPGVSVGATIISTDALLLPCWAAALMGVIKARAAFDARARTGWWLAAGFAVGFGLLAKYTMIAFLISLGLWLVAGDRATLRRDAGRIAAAGVLALLVLSPNLIWNAINGFVTFGHTGHIANLRGDLIRPDKFLEFVGAQFGVFGPILFAALIPATVRAWRDGTDEARLLAVMTWPLLGFYIGLSLLSRAFANWAAPAYVAATPLVVMWLMQPRRRPWLVAALALHVVAGALYLSYDWVVPRLSVAALERVDPFKRMRGWEALGAEVSRVLARHPDAALLANDRKLMAQLMFYVRPTPAVPVKWNPGDLTRDHYDLITDMEDLQGRPVVFVTPSAECDDICRAFATAERVERIVIPIGGSRTRVWHIFLLDGFKGAARS